MEPAKIDWKSIESVFVEDELYENMTAPKWIDFSAPDDSVDDEAWFCRPDCRHPKTVEDFLVSTPNSKVRLQSSTDVSDRVPLGERTPRDPNLKKRGFAKPSIPRKNISKPEKSMEDGENQNPNLITPHQQVKFMKEALRSSSEKKKLTDDMPRNEDTPWLKRTLSAQNLFAGRDILNQITEFCHELKKMATRAKEKESEDEPLEAKKTEQREILGEKKPLLEVSKQKAEAVQKSSGKLRRKKRVDETENTPPPAVDLKNIKRREESLLQIRTNPPSPQCFSATRGTSRVTPLKPSRCRPPEKATPQDLEQKNEEAKKNQKEDEGNNATRVSISVEREARALDVFWFLKPCTLST